MFGLRQWKVVGGALRYVYREGRRSKCWLSDESIIPVFRRIQTVLRKWKHDETTADIDIITQCARNVLFRIRDERSGGSFVCKAFFLHHLSHRLQYFNYGLDEASCLVTAKQRGISTPAVYGYGQLYDGCGLVRCNMVLLEDLGHLSTIRELMEKASVPERVELFKRTIPLFISLYKGNCNHIDVNHSAIMLDAADYDAGVYLLDFQHAQFHDSSSHEILMFETGYFARACREWISVEAVYDWLSEILKQIGVIDTSDQASLRGRFDYYFLSKGLSPTQGSLSRKQRKSIR